MHFLPALAGVAFCDTSSNSTKTEIFPIGRLHASHMCATSTFSTNEVEDMKTVVRRNWRELSESAAREQDPEKLLQLVEELNKALEEEENHWKKQISPPPRVAHSQSFACSAWRQLNEASEVRRPAWFL